MDVLLTGARPTGSLHLGHFLGAFEPVLPFRSEARCFFVVSDLHMLTTKFDVATTRSLRTTVVQLVAEASAFGLTTTDVTFYLQSSTPVQSRIYALIQSLASAHELPRHESFAEMERHSRSTPSLGLLGYPILEAADVISMQATHVAVGQNNLSHLDACLDIVRRLNAKWGSGLTTPTAVTGRENLPGLDGNEKMSKSLGNAIFLSDSPPEVASKCANMMDSTPTGSSLPLIYLEAFATSDDDIAEGRDAAQTGHSQHVRALMTRAIGEFHTPKFEYRQELLLAPDAIEDAIVQGTRAVRELQAPIYERLRASIGLPAF